MTHCSLFHPTHEATFLIVVYFQDRRHPHCERCEKGRIKCQGYNDTTFVDAKEQVLKLYKNGSKARSNSSMSIVSNARGASFHPDATDLGSATYCRRSAYLTDVSLPALQRMPSSPLTDEMCIAYTIANLAKGPLTIICHDVFLCDRSGLRANESVMRQCLSTLAKVYYGFQRNDSRALSNGIRSYGRVLGKLSGVLSNDNCRVTSDIIVSALALSLIEVCISPFGKVLRCQPSKESIDHSTRQQILLDDAYSWS